MLNDSIFKAPFRVVTDFRHILTHNSGQLKNGSYPLFAPKVSPAINCFCKKKNIKTGGKATRSEPAAMTFHAL